MTHYEFQPGKKKGRNRFVGSWSESKPSTINLDFTTNSLRTVLSWGCEPGISNFTHQDIAHWCDLFNTQAICGELQVPPLIRKIVEDIYLQWEMFLANSFSLKELQDLDFSKVQLPLEWFKEWQSKLELA